MYTCIIIYIYVYVCIYMYIYIHTCYTCFINIILLRTTTTTTHVVLFLGFTLEVLDPKSDRVAKQNP